MDTDYIFVYGLLKSNYENKPAKFIRKNCELIGGGSFSGILLDLGTYPGAIFDSTSPTNVFGEVFQIKQNKKALITFLDEFEGVGSQFHKPNEYVREVIGIDTKRGVIYASCYLYNWSKKGKNIIESGRYENALGKRN